MTQQDSYHCVSLSDIKISCISQKSYDELVVMSYWLWAAIIVVLVALTALPWVLEKMKGKL